MAFAGALGHFDGRQPFDTRDTPQEDDPGDATDKVGRVRDPVSLTRSTGPTGSGSVYHVRLTWAKELAAWRAPGLWSDHQVAELLRT